MTGTFNPGAASTYEVKWEAIDWNHLKEQVHRLQVRIAKAVKEKRWGKVKSLQHTLVTSWSAKALAVKKVTSNKGKHTPGVDGITWKTAKAKIQAISTLKKRGYKASPLRRVYIPKSNGKQRPLGIPTMKDRAMQALYAMALLPVAEATADPHSYGFRPNRSVADAIKQCHIALSCKNRAQWILEGDIKACFDKIDHQWLLANIPMDKAILSQWLKAGIFEEGAFYDTDEGTPQGGIISPILANMTLDGLQNLLKEIAPRNAKVNFIRYADDFICTGKDPELLEHLLKPAIKAFLQARGLTLSEEKTHITHIEEGLEFLGFHLRKYTGKMLIKPAKGKIKNLRQKLKAYTRQLRFRKTHLVIAGLNRILRGWGNFQRHVCASKVFSSIDHYLFQTIWRELRRRHPKKSARWIKKRYFKRIGRNQWTFSDKEIEKHRERTHYLFQLGGLSIRRHVKLPMACTPFDPEFKKYLSKRKAIQTSLRARDQLLNLRTRTDWKPLEKAVSSFTTGSP